MKNRTLICIAFITTIAFGCTWEACNKPGNHFFGCGGPMRGNEPTSVMLIFTNVNNAADVDTALWTSYFASAASSSGAHLTLAANTGYRVRVLFLNVHEAPSSSAYDVTPSVEKESSSYLVCFTDSVNLYGNADANLNWKRLDIDNSATPMPLGLTDSFWTGADSTCSIMATTLHHQYKLKNGDCDPGYIDIQALDTIYISPAAAKR